MDLAISAAALFVALAALVVAVVAWKSAKAAGRGDGTATAGRAALPDRSPAPEFVRPAAAATGAPPRVSAPADPLLVARLDALEARVTTMSAREERKTPTARRSASKGDAPIEAATAPRSDSVRRAFP